MKKIIISAALVLATIWCSHAQEALPQEEQILTPQEENETAVYNPEGRQIISESDVPSAIQDAFAKSEFHGMSIIEVYELTGEALDEIPTLRQEPKPNKLYELVVEDSSRSAILYFTEDGELYDSVEKV